MAYDPVKAHEYYVKFRKKGLKKGRKKGKGDDDSKSSKKSSKKTSLVGLSNSGLNDAGKMQYALVKDRLTSEMNEELDGVTDKGEIQRIREKYQQKALNEVTNLKNDSKYKQESKTSAKSTTKSTGTTRVTASTATKSTSTKASSTSSGKSSGKKKKSSSKSSSTASSSALASERAAAERKLATINRLKTEVQTLQQKVQEIISSGQISPENKGKAQTAINEVLSKLRELSAAAR